MSDIRIIDVRQSVFADNDADANTLRQQLKQEKTFLLNLMSSPGAGKTTLLKKVTSELKEKLRLAVMEADIDSDVDARAMKENGTVWVPTLSTVGNLRGKGRFDEAAVAAIWETAAENVRKFAQMGGLIAPGSDAGAWAVPHDADTEHRLLTDLLGPNAETILANGTAVIQANF